MGEEANTSSVPRELFPVYTLLSRGPDMKYLFVSYIKVLAAINLPRLPPTRSNSPRAVMQQPDLSKSGW